MILYKPAETDDVLYSIVVGGPLPPLTPTVPVLAEAEGLWGALPAHENLFELADGELIGISAWGGDGVSLLLHKWSNG